MSFKFDETDWQKVCGCVATTWRLVDNAVPMPHRFTYTAKSDGIAHPMDLRTQYHKTVSWNCKRSVALLQTHEENILPYTVKNDSAPAVTTFSRNFRFFALRKCLKMPEWNFSSIHDTCMSKIVYINS